MITDIDREVLTIALSFLVVVLCEITRLVIGG